MNELKPGCYVLATKWSDADPLDHWAVGFLKETIVTEFGSRRYDVVDEDGRSFRGNGFRRIWKISARRGAWLLGRVHEIEGSGRSLMWWNRQPMKE